MSYIGWRPVRGYEDAEWVKMRSGAGESGWWHRHEGETDFGGNPVDPLHCGTLACRTCGVQMPTPTVSAGDSK